MYAVAEEDDRRLTRRIDPDRRAGETGVTEAFADGEEVAAIAGEARAHVPAVGAQPGAVAAGDRARRNHLAHRGGAENAPAAVFAAAEHHLRVHGEIIGGRKQARVSGDVAHGEGPRVVHLAL